MTQKQKCRTKCGGRQHVLKRKHNLQAAPGEVEEAVKKAIDLGYRHIDCAMLYCNEKEIGAAIREKIRDGTVKREDLFVVTKLWNTFHEREMVVPTCQKSLANFGLDYVDLYLIHWPVAQKAVGDFNLRFPFENAVGLDYDYVLTWEGMQECVRRGLTKSIGLSNFNERQIDRILAASSIKPVMNQVRETAKYVGPVFQDENDGSRKHSPSPNHENSLDVFENQNFRPFFLFPRDGRFHLFEPIVLQTGLVDPENPIVDRPEKRMSSPQRIKRFHLIPKFFSQNVHFALVRTHPQKDFVKVGDKISTRRHHSQSFRSVIRRRGDQIRG